MNTKNDILNAEEDEIDFSAIEVIEFNGESFDFESLEEELENKLMSEFEDLDMLKEELKTVEDPDKLGKVILDEVWKQFGNQIGLDMTNETLIQKYDREHPESYADIKNSIMQDPAYKEAKRAAEEAQMNGTLIDEYTGKSLNPGDNVNVDHVIPRKEIFDDPRRKQANIDTATLANKEENLAVTNEALNKSKGAKTNTEYVNNREQREKELIAQNERANKIIEESNLSDVEKKLQIEENNKRLEDKLAADDELMLKAEKRAKNAINREINKGIVKEVGKKAGMDALKTMAVSALFTMLKEIMNGLVRFFKAKEKSFKLFLEEMKNAIKSFFSKILSVLQTGASTLIGTIVSEIFGPIVSTFKKLASLIKQGVSSLIDAVKYLSDPQNKNQPFSIKAAQVGKIVTTALVAGGAIFLGELFEKLLMTYVPIMNIKIPLLGSLANIVGLFLASVVSGVVGAIVINLLDKLIAEKTRQDINEKKIDKGNEILQTQRNLLAVNCAQMENTKAKCGVNIYERHNVAKAYIEKAVEDIKKGDDIERIDAKIIEEKLNDVWAKLDDF